MQSYLFSADPLYLHLTLDLFVVVGSVFDQAKLVYRSTATSRKFLKFPFTIDLDVC